MDGYISFSQLNDFAFCPESLYIHSLYRCYKKPLYQDTLQIDGTAAHETIDQGTYAKGGWLTHLAVCSPTYRLYGKCDLYHPRKGILVERKRTLHKIYDGQKYQVWAQAICLIEMGYLVHHIYLHSLTDNMRYTLLLPDESIRTKIKSIVNEIEHYTPQTHTVTPLVSKCTHCIYVPLCPLAQLSVHS